MDRFVFTFILSRSDIIFFIQLATELAKLSLDQSGPVKGSESKKNVLRRKSDLPQVCLERRYSGHKKNIFSLLEH